MTPPDRSAEETALFRRLGWRLMPLLTLLFLSAMLDRQNVGFAKLQMLSDLSMSEAAYGLGASLFFIGYVLFEVPISILVQRWGARVCLAAMVCIWGAATLLLAFTTSATMFYVLRFMLGVAQAGFIPGAMFYISSWFPASRRIRMLGYFTLGSSLGSMLGGLVNGSLLDLDGSLGLAGWQWMFVVSGGATIMLTFVVLGYLPSSPAQATFMSDADRQLLGAVHAREGSVTQSHDRPWAALWDPRVLGFGCIHMMTAIAFYGLAYWLPTVVRDFGVSMTVNGLLNMVPWAMASILLAFVPGLLRSDRSVFSVAAVITMLGLICFTTSVLITDNTLRFIALAIGGPCISLLTPLFWSFPPRFFSGARAAASLAAINSIGNSGGFAAHNLMPWVQEQTGSTAAPMLVPAACLAILFVGSIVCLVLINRSRAASVAA